MRREVKPSLGQKIKKAARGALAVALIPTAMHLVAEIQTPNTYHGGHPTKKSDVAKKKCNPVLAIGHQDRSPVQMMLLWDHLPSIKKMGVSDIAIEWPKDMPLDQKGWVREIRKEGIRIHAIDMPEELLPTQKEIMMRTITHGHCVAYQMVKRNRFMAGEVEKIARHAKGIVVAWVGGAHTGNGDVSPCKGPTFNQALDELGIVNVSVGFEMGVSAQLSNVVFEPLPGSKFKRADYIVDENDALAFKKTLTKVLGVLKKEMPTFPTLVKKSHHSSPSSSRARKK
ncbi:MAG: hypothetical protein ACOY3I_05495 [Verrucomicrobiota bacterium]